MRTLFTVTLMVVLAGCTSASRSGSEDFKLPDPAIAATIRSADSAILYSLLPLEHWNIASNYQDSRRSTFLLALPRFHDFPIFGTVDLTKRADWPRLSELLSTSFVHRPRMACDFSPRHGLRVRSGSAFIDVLMCFQCGDMVVYKKDSASAHRPVWSRSVRDEMNAVLDRDGIRRDRPGN